MARKKLDGPSVPPRKKTTIESLPAEIIAQIVGLVGAPSAPPAEFVALAEAMGANPDVPGFMAMMGGMLGAVVGGPGGARVIPVGGGVAGNGPQAGQNPFVFGPAAVPVVVPDAVEDFADMPPLQSTSHHVQFCAFRNDC